MDEKLILEGKHDLQDHTKKLVRFGKKTLCAAAIGLALLTGILNTVDLSFRNQNPIFGQEQQIADEEFERAGEVFITGDFVEKILYAPGLNLPQEERISEDDYHYLFGSSHISFIRRMENGQYHFGSTAHDFDGLSWMLARGREEMFTREVDIVPIQATGINRLPRNNFRMPILREGRRTHFQETPFREVGETYLDVDSSEIENIESSMGLVKSNNATGTYGVLHDFDSLNLQPYTVGRTTPGPATLHTRIDEAGVQEFQVYLQESYTVNDINHVRVLVIDPRLQGISFGMSGSSITRDGQWIASISHGYPGIDHPLVFTDVNQQRFSAIHAIEMIRAHDENKELISQQYQIAMQRRAEENNIPDQTK